MGTISKGILGGFSGTVGTVIGGTWKGIDYMRSKPVKRKGSFTPAQLEQQAKFTVAIRFVTALSGLYMISFRNYAVKMTGVNNAFAYVLKNAISGVYPLYGINYPSVLVSRGDLPNVLAPAATAEADSKIAFTWTDNTGTGIARADDKALLVVYCPEMNLCIYTTGSAGRNALTDILDVSTFSGRVVETWLGFIAADGRNIAGSLYTGQLTVS